MDKGGGSRDRLLVQGRVRDLALFRRGGLRDC
jgi:hypothetical protein